jgi:hypothetical protein
VRWKVKVGGEGGEAGKEGPKSGDRVECGLMLRCFGHSSKEGEEFVEDRLEFEIETVENWRKESDS